MTLKYTQHNKNLNRSRNFDSILHNMHQVEMKFSPEALGNSQET